MTGLRAVARRKIGTMCMCIDMPSRGSRYTEMQLAGRWGVISICLDRTQEFLQFIAYIYSHISEETLRGEKVRYSQYILPQIIYPLEYNVINMNECPLSSARIVFVENYNWYIAIAHRI
jgi:hypothetical protein